MTCFGLHFYLDIMWYDKKITQKIATYTIVIANKLHFSRVNVKDSLFSLAAYGELQHEPIPRHVVRGRAVLHRLWAGVSVRHHQLHRHTRGQDHRVQRNH